MMPPAQVPLPMLLIIRVSQAALQVASLYYQADHVATGQVQLCGLPCDYEAKPYEDNELS